MDLAKRSDGFRRDEQFIKATRELLSRHYFFDSLFPQQVQTASDGTEKTAGG
ncbi:MAG: hypothetical protein ACLU30_14825 [Odoribacter splanchnicus]